MARDSQVGLALLFGVLLDGVVVDGFKIAIAEKAQRDSFAAKLIP